MKILAGTVTLMIFLGVLLCFSRETKGESIKVHPADCEIVVPQQASPVIEYAVDELKKHIRLITGKNLEVTRNVNPGRFRIYVGMRPADDKKSFLPEEARYLVTPEGIWLYGMDECKNIRNESSSMETALAADTRAGTLFAVYEFLENELGVRWLEPGDKGIVYKKCRYLEFKPGQEGWIPQLVQRHMRSAYKDRSRARWISDGNIPEELRFSDKEFAKLQNDEIIWKRRMRMGRSREISYGSPFSGWWSKYSETHPEFFAMNPNGKRAPRNSRAAKKINMCVSNPDLVKQVVKEHIADGSGPYIKNSDNDSHGFCNCEKCRALDAETLEEKTIPFEMRSKSDRYIHFTNALLKEARKYDPGVKTVYYAYSRFHQAPRREKLDPDIIVLMIPNLSLTFNESEEFFKGWNRAGARELYMRPNDLNQDTGLPLGFEQCMFSRYKQSFKYLNMTGTDYDSCQGFWPVSGIANYIMARGFYRPDRSFEYWENEYYQAFGPASDEVRRYYQYWRQIWNKRVMSNRNRIKQLPCKLTRTKLLHLGHLLYSDIDFDLTDGFLKAGLNKKDLSENERQRLENLLLSNKHNRLKYKASAANRLASDASGKERESAARALYKFRLKHRDDLAFNWENMIYLENLYEDNAGQQRLLDSEPEKRRVTRLKLDSDFKRFFKENNYKLN